VAHDILTFLDDLADWQVEYGPLLDHRQVEGLEHWRPFGHEKGAPLAQARG
jgi:hypothetical protein